jgi:hypothetical protein
VQKAALVEMHKQPAAAAAFSNTPSKNLSINSPIQKILTSSFRESFVSSVKQGDGATVPGEGHDVVARETCFPTSFSEHKKLRKSSCAAFCLFAHFCSWGRAKFSL